MGSSGPRRVLLGAMAAVALAAGCSSSPRRSSATPSTSSSTTSVPATVAPASTTTTPVASAAPPLTWSACSGGAGPKDYQCATLQVPRDPQHPGVGGTIGLALDRRPASGARVGSILVNPGGPGGSGVDFLPQLVPILPKSILARFDIVGFDPPGVGRSAPIRCLSPAGLSAYFDADPAPATAAALSATIAEDRVFASGCEQRSGAELPYVSTVDAAIDMDHIRQAVGDAKLTYFGFSYGTFLGSTYARLFPGRIRAMVLDGAMDPALTPIQALDDQAAALDLNLKAALRACTSDPACDWKPGRDPVSAFLALMQRLGQHPIAVPGTGQSVGPAELLYGTGLTLYSQQTWGVLAEALAQLSAGNGKEMLDLFNEYVGRRADGTYSNEQESNIAVNCSDSPAPSTGQIEAAAGHAAAVAPVFGVPDLYSELQCAVWPVPAQAPVQPGPGALSATVVVVGSTEDPATPYQEAVSLTSELGRAVLLTRQGYGHTGYLYSSCIRRYVDPYLLDVTVPPAGVNCPL